MSDNKTVVVNILDKDYQIACPLEERDALHSAAEELDHRMREIRNAGNVIGLDRIAVMAALNLCHELQQIQGSGKTGTPMTGLDKETLTRLKKKIDKALQSS